MTPANFLAYAAQITIIVLACAGLPRLLGLRSPAVQYAFWRTITKATNITKFTKTSPE
jgi:hypothetical protein